MGGVLEDNRGRRLFPSNPCVRMPHPFLQKQLTLLVAGILLSTGAVLVITGTEGAHPSIGTAARNSGMITSTDESPVHSNNRPSSAKRLEDRLKPDAFRRPQTASPAGTAVKIPPTSSSHIARPSRFEIAKSSHRSHPDIVGSGAYPPTDGFPRPTISDVPLVYKITDEAFQKRLPHVSLDALDSIRSEFDKQAGVGELPVDDPEYARRWTLADPTATDRMRTLFGWAAVAEFQRQAQLQSDGRD